MRFSRIATRSRRHSFVKTFERGDRVAAHEDEVIDAGRAQTRLEFAGTPGDDEALRAGGLDRGSKGLGARGVGFVVAAQAGERSAAGLEPGDGLLRIGGLAVIDGLDAAGLQPIAHVGDTALVHGFGPDRHEIGLGARAARLERRVGTIAQRLERLCKTNRGERARVATYGAGSGAPGARSTGGSSSSGCALTPVIGVLTLAISRLRAVEVLRGLALEVAFGERRRETALRLDFLEQRPAPSR